MAIAAANLFTRNIFTEFFKPDATPQLQTKVSQWASLVVKLGALYFAVELPHTFAINLQLLGGVWILQIGPMLIGGLFTRWFDRYALLLGWLAGMAFGTIAAYRSASAHRLALGLALRHRVRPHGLHRPVRLGHQPDRGRGTDGDLPGREGLGGCRRDPAAPVHRRPRRSRRPRSSRGQRAEVGVLSMIKLIAILIR